MEIARHRLTNIVHSIVLLTGMAALFGLCGWIVAGQTGLAALAFAGVLLVVLAPRMPPPLVLRSIGARPLARAEAPELHAVLDELTARAGVDVRPALYFVSSPEMMAFTIGRRDQSVMVVTAGLLRGLTFREIVAVLAHEMSHVRNDDIWILGLADMVTRLTRLASLFGLVLIVINLPLIASGAAQVSWILILVLLFAPTVSALLQLGLSRTREFRADLDAVALSGDPEGLSDALARLERANRIGWERLFGYRGGDPVPSLLRSHPRTEERIRRLATLKRPPAAPPLRPASTFGLPPHVVPSQRRRLLGPW